ncbi:hypothetical protein PENSPDRAFT_692335 [Peniophora sp. CONT]|nr:hypothetical protein PENSPDRAFT_692335 [Peniophora sp. CONT]
MTPLLGSQLATYAHRCRSSSPLETPKLALLSEVLGQAMDHTNAITPTRTRIQLSDSLKRDAKGAVKTAVELLGVAASMTQNVPYLGIISGALTELLKIENEIDTLKSDWRLVMSLAKHIKSIIDRVRAQCEKLGADGDVLPEGLLEPLIELERCILTALEVLNTCKVGSKRFRDRARVYLNRSDLAGNVKQCRTDMEAALNLFNTKLHIIHTFKLDEMLSRGSIARPSLVVPPIPISLPPPPAIFHGRALETDHIVDLIFGKPPARVAVLGSGGIGKTSIALTVLHRPEIKEHFDDGRFFMSCEAVSTGDGVIQELLKTFRLAVDAQSRITPRDLLLSHLRALPRGILCLDNLETPWDADASSVESLLADIVSLSHFSLLVTTRGGDRPRGVAWTQPFLPEITPLTLEAALDTWNAICGSHNDYSELLVKAVDLVPLAVTLLAQLALTETSEVLYSRWELEETRLLQSTRGPEHRLNSVDRSIMLSLTSPVLRDKEDVLNFFSILCTLPQGLPESRIPAFVDAYASLLPDLRRSIAILKQCSLVYTSEDCFLRVLSPIRHYIQSHYPCSGVSFATLTDVYCSLIESCPDGEGSYIVYARAMVQPELINISAILDLSLSREVHVIYRSLNVIASFSHIRDALYVYSTTLASRAIAYAERHAPEVEASLWQSMGDTLRFQQQFNEALLALSKALELSRMEDNQEAEANNSLRLGRLYNDLMIKHEEAEKFLLSALDLYTKLEIPLGRARALRELGELYICARDGHHTRYDETERVLQAALDIYEQIGDKRGKADVLISLGRLDLWQRGRLDEAKAALTIALDINDRIDFPSGKANAMAELAAVYARLHCEQEAEAMLLSALDICRQLNNSLGQANSLKDLGELYQNQKLHDKAVHALQAAIKLYDNIGNHLGQAGSLLALGRSYLNLAHLADAEHSIESALALFRDINDRLWELITLFELADLRRLQNRHEEACNTLQWAHDIAAEVVDLEAQGVALERLGRVHTECGELDLAQGCFEDALQLFERSESSKNADIARARIEALHLERQTIAGQDKISQPNSHRSRDAEGSVVVKGE